MPARRGLYVAYMHALSIADALGYLARQELNGTVALGLGDGQRPPAPPEETVKP